MNLHQSNSQKGLTETARFVSYREDGNIPSIEYVKNSPLPLYGVIDVARVSFVILDRRMFQNSIFERIRWFLELQRYQQ